MGTEGIRFKTCKFGHDLSDAHVWGGIRYCRKCKQLRGKYTWWVKTLKDLGCTDQIVSWQKFSVAEFGQPIKRVRL